jgi:hypothetical protein
MNTPWFWFLDFPKKWRPANRMHGSGARRCPDNELGRAETYSGPMQSPFFVPITLGSAGQH